MVLEAVPNPVEKYEFEDVIYNYPTTIQTCGVRVGTYKLMSRNPGNYYQLFNKRMMRYSRDDNISTTYIP
ncbi:hypothetical protein J6590_107878 [Homalodisca vitripennis]|nr:hypothetical protein J6590_107878 [Homalodisca vitripennis]